MAATQEVTELRAELERLSRELDQASSEKIQSAQYGLGLLEEKSLLQQKCEELETLYDNTRHELDITQEVGVRLLSLLMQFFFFFFFSYYFSSFLSTLRLYEYIADRLFIPAPSLHTHTFFLLHIN